MLGFAKKALAPTADAQTQGETAGPRHVAIIMDGNGRWAKKHHLPRALGHKKGVEAVREIVRYAATTGLEALSLYAFPARTGKGQRMKSAT